jgi:hypothetical protein
LAIIKKNNLGIKIMSVPVTVLGSGPSLPIAPAPQPAAAAPSPQPAAAAPAAQAPQPAEPIRHYSFLEGTKILAFWGYNKVRENPRKTFTIIGNTIGTAIATPYMAYNIKKGNYLYVVTPLMCFAAYKMYKKGCFNGALFNRVKRLSTEHVTKSRCVCTAYVTAGIVSNYFCPSFISNVILGTVGLALYYPVSRINSIRNNMIFNIDNAFSAFSSLVVLSICRHRSWSPDVTILSTMTSFLSLRSFLYGFNSNENSYYVKTEKFLGRVFKTPRQRRIEARIIREKQEKSDRILANLKRSGFVRPDRIQEYTVRKYIIDAIDSYNQNRTAAHNEQHLEETILIYLLQKRETTDANINVINLNIKRIEELQDLIRNVIAANRNIQPQDVEADLIPQHIDYIKHSSRNTPLNVEIIRRNHHRRHLHRHAGIGGNGESGSAQTNSQRQGQAMVLHALPGSTVVVGNMLPPGQDLPFALPSPDIGASRDTHAGAPRAIAAAPSSDDDEDSQSGSSD